MWNDVAEFLSEWEILGNELLSFKYLSFKYLKIESKFEGDELRCFAFGTRWDSFGLIFENRKKFSEVLNSQK